MESSIWGVMLVLEKFLILEHCGDFQIRKVQSVFCIFFSCISSGLMCSLHLWHISVPWHGLLRLTAFVSLPYWTEQHRCCSKPWQAMARLLCHLLSHLASGSSMLKALCVKPSTQKEVICGEPLLAQIDYHRPRNQVINSSSYLGKLLWDPVWKEMMTTNAK